MAEPQEQNQGFKPKLPTGVGFVETAAARKRGGRKIYLFKSISKLPPKEKLYAIGYNLTSLSYIMPIGALGSIISIPYMIGETANNLKAMQGFLRGDTKALLGRGRFLGGANLVNKQLGSAINAVKIKTGVGPIDRIASVAVGKQKAQALQYMRGKSTSDRLKALSQLNPFKFDKSIAAQSQIPNKNNVFQRWQVSTFMNAMKDAPDPFKENPYHAARKAQRNHKTIKGKSFNNVIPRDSSTMTTERMNQIMSLNDDVVNDIANIQAIAHDEVIDYILGVDNSPAVKRIARSGMTPSEKRRKFYKAEERRVRGMFGRRDTIMYNDSGRLDVFGQEVRGLDDNVDSVLPRYVKAMDIEINDTEGFITSKRGRRHAERAERLLMMRTFRDASPSASKNLSPELIFNSLAETAVNEEIMTLFNTFAANMGTGMVIQPGDNMRGLVGKIATSLFSMSTNFNSNAFGGNMLQRIATVEKFAEDLYGLGYKGLGSQVVRLFSSGSGMFDEGGRLLIPDRADIRVRAGGKESGRLVDALNQMRHSNKSFSNGNRKRYYASKNSHKSTYANIHQVYMVGSDFDLAEYIDGIEAEKLAKSKIISKRGFTNNIMRDAESRKKFLEDWFESGGQVFSVHPRQDLANYGFDEHELTKNGKLPRGGQMTFPQVHDSSFATGPGGKPILTRRAGGFGDRSKVDQFAKVLGYRTVDDFIKTGGSASEFKKLIEYEYNRLQGHKLSKIISQQDQFMKESDRAINESILRQDDALEELTMINKKGKYVGEARRGQTVTIPSHHNYTPTRNHIRQSIHMFYDGKGINENDGSGYLFRYGVEFGGRTAASKSADYIRDAVAIEFGGPATDKQGNLARRTDRMFYLPSYFMQMSATKAAAYFGVFDKGTVFKGSSKRSGVMNATFSIDDKASIGAFNSLRRSDSAMRKDSYRGHRRVKKLFKDLEKGIADAEKANYGNQLNGAVREAHHRALARFKASGEFGTVRMTDVFRTVNSKEARSFSIDEGTRVFNEKKLGTYKPQGLVRVASLAGRMNIDGMNYERNKGRKMNVYTQITENLANPGRGQAGYSPVVDVVGEEFMDANVNPANMRGNIAHDVFTDLRASRKDFMGLEGDLSFQERAEINFQILKSSLNAPDNQKLSKMFANPYDSMLEEFDLGATQNGTWKPDNGIITDFNNPKNPYRKFNDMFMNNTFKTQLVKELYNDAVYEARHLLEMFPNDADEIMRKILSIATGGGMKIDRALGRLLFDHQNAGWFSGEDGFRRTLINLASYIEGIKAQTKVRVSQIAEPFIKNARQAEDIIRIATDYGHLKKKNIGMDTAFNVLDESLAKGVSVMYGNEMGELIGVDIANGQREMISDVSSEALRALYPSVKGRSTKKMLFADARQQRLVNMMGANSFEEIDFSRRGAQGLHNIDDVADDIKPFIAQNATNMDDALRREMFNDGLDPDNPQDVAKYIEQGSGETAEVARLIANDRFEAERRLQALLGNKVNNKKVNAEAIVAETRHNKAHYNDFTPDKADILVMNNRSVGIEADNYLKFISRHSAADGGKIGAEFITTFGSHIITGRMTNAEAFALIKASLHVMNKKQRSHFINKIYSKMVLNRTGKAKSVLKSSEALGQFDAIFSYGGLGKGFAAEIFTLKFSQRIKYFDELADAIVGIAGADVLTVQDLVVFRAGKFGGSRGRKKGYHNKNRGRRSNNYFPGVRSKKNNKGDFTGVKDVTGPGFEEPDGMNYSAYKAYVKNKERKAYVKKRWYGK